MFQKFSKNKNKRCDWTPPPGPKDELKAKSQTGQPGWGGSSTRFPECSSFRVFLPVACSQLELQQSTCVLSPLPTFARRLPILADSTRPTPHCVLLCQRACVRRLGRQRRLHCGDGEALPPPSLCDEVGADVLSASMRHRFTAILRISTGTRV